MKHSQTQHPNRDHRRQESFMPTCPQPTTLGLAIALSLAIGIHVRDHNNWPHLAFP